jgi:UDP-galactopyranose mutase
MRFDYLIVGAGFAGSVLAERLATQANKRVLVVERRSHIAGNAFDEYDESGILVHRYGPHIFHTNSTYAFQYLSRFTKWRPYEHRVLTSVDGRLLPFPINLDTINQLYGTSLTSEEMKRYLSSVVERRTPNRTAEDVVVAAVGRELYEKFFRGYTRKQWGVDPSQLAASVTARIPVRTNRDPRYFTDAFQGIPLDGYTAMFRRMLKHSRITLLLGTDFQDVRHNHEFGELIYTGPIDEFYNYRFGPLPYRSLRFEFRRLDIPWFQPVAQVNYPNDYDYTRITEFKHLTGQRRPRTSIAYEYPMDQGEPFYPVLSPENCQLYNRYRVLAQVTRGVHFVGRLATYKYYNMDQVVAQALATFTRLTGRKVLPTLSTSIAGGSGRRNRDPVPER